MAPNDDQASEADLQAVLAGMPSSLSVPYTSARTHRNDRFLSANTNSRQHPPESVPTSESLFGRAVANSPCMKLTIPERPPISGLVEISVGMDLETPKGFSVDVSDALSADLNTDILGEVRRRGRILSLSGRVWNGTRLS